VRRHDRARPDVRLAKLKVPVPVVGILSSAENHISSRAYRPGDILRMYNGVTVEVTNTDAEGRLVLGDAIAWGIETYKPRAVIDLATLTGGVIVALGKTMAGVMSNSDTLVERSRPPRRSRARSSGGCRSATSNANRSKATTPTSSTPPAAKGTRCKAGRSSATSCPPTARSPGPTSTSPASPTPRRSCRTTAKGATGWGVRTLVEWVRSKDESHLKHATPRAAGG
jgi:hypothetical protein